MPRRRSTPPASTSSPASSIRTCTSTIPGRAEWEGFETGTAAFAAGGGTCFFDMPLNASPPTVDGASFDLKVEAARGTALVDFCLWGGLVPGDLDRLDELADRGVIGFKAFMCNTGIGDFEQADDQTLFEGMERAARLGLPVAVHAENDAVTQELAARARAEGRRAMSDYLASRPAAAELEAVGSGDRDRRGDGLLASHRPREHGRRGAARRRGARPWRRRDLRDVSRTTSCSRTRTRSGSARSPSARRRCGRAPRSRRSGRSCSRARSRSSPPTTRRRRRT